MPMNIQIELQRWIHVDKGTLELLCTQLAAAVCVQFTESPSGIVEKEIAIKLGHVLYAESAQQPLDVSLRQRARKAFPVRF